jgi:hypothetical protein
MLIHMILYIYAHRIMLCRVFREHLRLTTHLKLPGEQVLIDE